ncbi:MAG: DUF2442 domain-containing protein [Cytophagaceae bacterium]|nr:DUF2442 domain-containing protein [Cytophagaceae bacterium]
MLLNVIAAQYEGDYRVLLTFNTGETRLVDLEQTIFNDHRRVFELLRDKNYFAGFNIGLNTITWPNEADFAPEFLFELGVQPVEKELTA